MNFPNSNKVSKHSIAKESECECLSLIKTKEEFLNKDLKRAGETGPTVFLKVSGEVSTDK